MNEVAAIGRLVEITLSLGGSLYTAHISEADEHRLDAAWTEYVDGGKTRDRVFEVEGANGDPIKFLLSDLHALEVSTREGRAANRARSLGFKAERREDGLLDDD